MVTLVPHLPELHSIKTPRITHTANAPLLFLKGDTSSSFQTSYTSPQIRVSWLHQYLNTNIPRMLWYTKYLLINVLFPILC